MQGKKQYSEKLFTSFQLSDRIPADNFYRRLSAAENTGGKIFQATQTGQAATATCKPNQRDTNQGRFEVCFLHQREHWVRYRHI